MASMTSELRETAHRLLTVDEYYRMAEAGIISPDERTELIEGEIIRMAPMKSLHASTCAWLNERFILNLKGTASVRCQLPVRLNDKTEPEPDIAICRRAGYEKAHPTAQDVLLIIEVSDSTYRYDRYVKVPLYALHSVPEVWLIDLNAKQIEIFQRPQGESYETLSKTDLAAKISPLRFPEVAIDFNGLR
jgi:Uma2 family endonuclease